MHSASPSSLVVADSFPWATSFSCSQSHVKYVVENRAKKYSFPNPVFIISMIPYQQFASDVQERHQNPSGVLSNPMSHAGQVGQSLVFYVPVPPTHSILCVRPIPPVPCRTSGTVLWNPTCPTNTLNPMCPSYPTYPM